MRQIYLSFTVIALFTVFSATAQDTNIYFRFSNPQVVPGPTNDTLVFDVEAKSNVTGTYVTAFGMVIIFSTTAFGSSALPVAFQRLALTNTTGYNFPATFGNAGTDGFAQTLGAWGGIPPHWPGYNTTLLGSPTLDYQGVVRYKMLITGTGNAGIDFKNTMIGQQFYVITSGGLLATTYDNVFFENDLLNFPTALPLSDLMFSELADPSDSNGDFIEIYNPENQTVDFNAVDWWLTHYDGVDYDSIQLTGSIAPGAIYVIGGPNFASAYPGKSANLTASFVETSGTDVFYLSAFHSYNYGTLMDVYDASSVSYTGKHAVRPYPSTSPNTTFTPGEWIVSAAATMDMTPGSHRRTIVWDGSSDDTWRDTANWTPPHVPDVGHNAEIPTTAPTQPLVNTGANVSCYDFIIGQAIPARGMEERETRLPEEEE